MLLQVKDLPENVPSHVPRALVFESELIEPVYIDNPIKVYQRIIEQLPPIFFQLDRTEIAVDAGGWTIARADLQREVLQNPDLFRSTSETAIGVDVWPQPLIPFTLDPPDHGKYRSILAPIFSPRAIQAMDDRIRTVCNTLLDRIVPAGESASFMDDFARPYPATVFMAMMGMPLEQQATFVEWEETLLSGAEGTALEDIKGAVQSIYDCMDGLIEERKKQPRDDIISHLIRAEIDGKPIEKDDLLGTCGLLFMAGLDTVTAGLLHIFYYLGINPDQKQKLIDDPELVPSAIEELLRYYSWIISPRYVKRDVEFHGISMQAGDRIILPFIYASHDPGVVGDPDEVDFHRGPNPHFAFGAGVHRCAGSHLARRELRVALSAWLEKAPDFHLTDGYKVTYKLGNFHPSDLHLKWTMKE